ncbi:hypothetical protein Pcinc_028325 [Petrolisthes cinctipes]|uniref:Regulatory protein zeste n=1 Tax=Petrolisthes cinctipes TaxID=88211 RepID=A0AAE1F2K9_PETCI|nr:hypothetical protein Pcinc_028325 [Petrolisthes cinctipes]
MEGTSVEAAARVSPMSQAERSMLIALIEEEPIVTNKETNGKVVALKIKAWDRVENKFNAMNLGPNRTKKQLQKVWDRLKTKREEKKTGGGAPPPEVPKDVEKVLSFIAPEVNDLGCDFDDDALPALTNSYSFGTITQEAVILEVNPDDPEPVNMPTATVVTSAETPGHSRDTTGASGYIPLSVHGKSSTTKKRRRIRRSLYDEDIYAGPEEVINTTQKEINMRQNLITHRQTLLDIQKRQAEVRLEEAEYQRQLALEKLEEAEY